MFSVSPLHESVHPFCSFLDLYSAHQIQLLNGDVLIEPTAPAVLFTPSYLGINFCQMGLQQWTARSVVNSPGHALAMSIKKLVNPEINACFVSLLLPGRSEAHSAFLF